MKKTHNLPLILGIAAAIPGHHVVEIHLNVHLSHLSRRSQLMYICHPRTLVYIGAHSNQHPPFFTIVFLPRRRVIPDLYDPWYLYTYSTLVQSWQYIIKLF